MFKLPINFVDRVNGICNITVQVCAINNVLDTRR